MKKLFLFVFCFSICVFTYSQSSVPNFTKEDQKTFSKNLFNGDYYLLTNKNVTSELPEQYVEIDSLSNKTGGSRTGTTFITSNVFKFRGQNCYNAVFASTSGYNIQKMNSVEVAKRMISEKYFPLIVSFSDKFNFDKFKDIQYIAITISYLMKDFTEKYDLGDRYSITVFTKCSDLKKFYNLELSDEDLIKNSVMIMHGDGGTYITKLNIQK